MLSYEVESRQNSFGLRYPTPTPRSNGTRYQPNDPFTIPQTPKKSSRPVSPEIELANVSTSPLSPTNPKWGEFRDRRLSRSLRATPPYSRVSSPAYNFSTLPSPFPIRGSYSLETPKDPTLRAISMRQTRSSPGRSRSPRGRYTVNYDPPLSQIHPSFSLPISLGSPVNYRNRYGGAVDSFSGSSAFTSPRPRYHPRPNLQDLSPLFYTPSPNDTSSLKAGFTTQEYYETQELPTFNAANALPFEVSESFFAPKPISKLPPPRFFNDTSDVASRHTPEIHSIPSTTSPVPSKHDLDTCSSSANVSGAHDAIPQVDEPERFMRLKDYAKFFITDTIPRQLYLLFLFRLPALYFVRVARIFEESDLTLEEIGEMAVEAVNAQDDGQEDSNTKYDRLKKAWELLITRLVREWETFNVVSVLLLPAIVTMFQIQGATNDPVTRYIAFWSLICALLSSLYDCLFIICFPTMRKPHKAAAWAFEALKTHKIFWNVWVMLAMPAVWICWSILTFIVCIMSFMWRAKAELPPDHQFIVAPSTELVMRILICLVLGLGVAYGFLIFTTLTRFGSGMDKAWRLRAEAFYAPPMPHTTVTSLPPEYHATEPPVAEGTSHTEPAERGPDHSGSGNLTRDQIVVNARNSTSDPSNLPPAYPPPPNPTIYPQSISSVLPLSTPPLPAHRSLKRHMHSHNGRTNTFGLPLTGRDSIDSPQHRQTYIGRRSPDDKISPDDSEERGRSTIAHSRSRSHLQSHADYAVGAPRGSPEVRTKRPDNEKRHPNLKDSLFLDFSSNDGDILLEEIGDKDQGEAKSS